MESIGFCWGSGASGSIVSNRSSGGKVERVETLLEKTLGLKGNHLDLIKAKIEGCTEIPFLFHIRVLR
jgi:hypothetical protein